MLAFAKASGRAIRIWEHQEQNLYLIGSSFEREAPTSIIDVLHAWNGTHYQRLECTSVKILESLPSPNESNLSSDNGKARA